MTPRMRKLAGAAAYVAFLFILVEIALQIFYYATAGDFLFRRTGVAIWAPNEHSGVFNRPNLDLEHHTNEFTNRYYTNSAGFRVPGPGREFALDKPGGTYRILLLGPSFAYGWGVDYEDSFAGVLERRLEASGAFGDRDVEVLNAGVPAMAPAPQLRWYEKEGSRYDPDLVIQFIYASMAVENDPVMRATANEEGYLISPNHTLAKRIRERAKRIATVFYGWVIWTRLDQMIGSGSQEEDRTVLGAGREMKAASEFAPDAPEVVSALDFYHDLERIVRGNGAELLVLYFPLSYVVHAEDVSRWKHLGVQDVPAQIAFDDAFARYLTERGLPVVNATGPLQRAAEKGERLYYWLDIHWTARGNEVAADVIAEYLARRGGAPLATVPAETP